MTLGTNRIDITENEDLNNIIVLGSYRCSSNAIAETLLNCPITKGFTLDVKASLGTGDEKLYINTYSYMTQTLTDLNGFIYVREIGCSNTDTFFYGGWRSIATSHDINALKSSFQGGCDTLVAKCNSLGVYPATNSPTDISNAIHSVADLYYNTGYADGAKSDRVSWFTVTLVNHEEYLSNYIIGADSFKYIKITYGSGGTWKYSMDGGATFTSAGTYGITLWAVNASGNGNIIFRLESGTYVSLHITVTI